MSRRVSVGNGNGDEGYAEYSGTSSPNHHGPTEMCRTSGHPRRPVLDALKPTATRRLEEYAVPFESEAVEVIWSTSLFTHLLPNAGTTALARCAESSRPA